MRSEKPVIIFLDRETLPDSVEVHEPEFDHELRIFGTTRPDQVAERIADADIVITNKAPIRAESIAGAPHLRLIAIAATGYDVVDVEACRTRSIAISNIRNYAVNTVPEHTFALMLALRRSILDYRESVRDGRWIDVDQFSYFDYPIADLAGSVLGIIGNGVIGQAVAQIGRAFGMKPIFAAHKGAHGMGSLYTSFDDVLKLSDVITLHAPLNSSTRNMIAGPEFAKMERRPLIINTSRGGLVDEEALAAALAAKQIAGAGFDVATVEPPPEDHVMMRLLSHNNFILTPHIAWASREAIQTLSDQLTENINLFWRGEPRNLVA